MEEHAKRASTKTDIWAWLRAAHLLCQRLAAGPRSLQAARSADQRGRPARTRPRTITSTTSRSRRSSSARSCSSWARPASRAKRMAMEGYWRRVNIEKPFGRDLESGARAEHRHPEDARRAPDLPHRPLPRQGDRAEPHGLPLRQQHLRADLEPQLHRPCADHRGGNARRRACAAATTRRRARCATWCPTTCSSWCR